MLLVLLLVVVSAVFPGSIPTRWRKNWLIEWLKRSMMATPRRLISRQRGRGGREREREAVGGSGKGCRGVASRVFERHLSDSYE